MKKSTVPEVRKQSRLRIVLMKRNDAYPGLLTLREDWEATGEYEIVCSKTDLEEFNRAVQFAANALADELWEYQHKVPGGGGSKNGTPGEMNQDIPF